MRFQLVFSAVVMLSMAQQTHAQSTQRGLAGVWAITIGTPDNPEYRSLDITIANDGQIRGQIGSPNGAVSIDSGRIDGARFAIAATLGTGLRLTYNGAITNDTVRGIWTYDKFQGRFVGVRGTTPPRADATPVTRDDVVVDATLRGATLDSLVREIRHRYVDTAAIARIVATLEERARIGAYDTLTTPRSFARALTEDLRRFDKHFAIMPAAANGAPTIAATARDNYAIKKVERLDGNVGYLKLDVFSPDSAAAAPVLRSALRFLARTDALILDLRENHGGGGDLSQLLFAQLGGTLDATIADTFTRNGNTFDSTVIRTARRIDADAALRDQPIYVLTSPRTASAAEWLAYNLQAAHRATIVGETTAGASHPIRFVRLNAAFDMSLPNARVRSRLTNADFERVGVRPELSTTADGALRLAYLTSLTSLLSRATDPLARAELERAIAAQRSNG